MIEENINREIFGETLDSLIESDSVKCSLISNRTSLSLRKHNTIENSNLQGNFNNLKEDLIEYFGKFKKKMFYLERIFLSIFIYIISSRD